MNRPNYLLHGGNPDYGLVVYLNVGVSRLIKIVVYDDKEYKEIIVVN